MKKTILLVVVLLCSTVVLAAYTTVESLGKSGDYKVTYSQTIQKGWNLLPSEIGSWSLSSDINPKIVENFWKAGYLYLPAQKQYISFWGGFSDKDQQAANANKEFLRSSAAWYYFSAPVTMSFVAEDGGGMPKLQQGWNFLTIGPSLSLLNPDVKTSNHFPVGDCKFEKLFTWDSQTQKWSEKNMGMSSVEDALDELSDPDAIGAGVVIKVKNTCQLGTNSDSDNRLAPPTIPQDVCEDTDGGNEYTIKGKILDDKGKLLAEDSCNGFFLKEHQCAGSIGYGFEEVKCSEVVPGSSCVNGACIS